MTELEKMQRAKMYIDKLANGINPLDDTAVPEEDVINQVRLSRCFFYVSDVLRQVIENGGIKKANNAHKADFYLSDEQRKSYIPSATPIPVSKITQALNSLADLAICKKIGYSQITDWLIDIGALKIVTDSEGSLQKRPTEQGEALGISVEVRNGMRGLYHVVVYNRDAQQFIVDNLDAVLSYKK